jgi:hypothetical protein
MDPQARTVIVSTPAQQLRRRAIEPFAAAAGANIVLVLVMIAVRSSLQHNGEIDALALLEFKTPFAQ